MAAAPAWAPYALAALGTAASLKATSDAADDRRSITNQQLERDAATSKKVVQLVSDQAQKTYDPMVRQQAMTDQENANFNQSQKDLQTGAGGADLGAVTTSGDAGNVSDDFLKAKADRAVTEGNRLTTIARALSKTRAPAQLQTDEGYSSANLAGDLQNLQSSNQGYANAAQADASGVDTGALGALGGLASAAAAAYAASGTKKTAAPTTAGITF